MWWLVTGWVGCAGPTDDDKGDDDGPRETASHTAEVDPDHTGHSGFVTDTSGETRLSARCQIQTNALRFDCRALVDPPQPVTMTWVAADGTGKVRSRRSDVVVALHDLVLWYFAGDRDYVVTVTTDDGASVDVPVRTGTPPGPVDVAVTTTGTSTADLFLSTSPCFGGIAMAWDPATQEVVWYEQLGFSLGQQLEGVSATDDGAVLGLAAGSTREVTWGGTIVRELRVGTDLPNHAHHDAFKRDGLTYVIFQEVVPGPPDVRVDGFYVFDAAGLSWEFHVTDVLRPDLENLGRKNTDWSHANAVWADAQGDVYASYRHLSAVVKVEGDPTSPQFGQALWKLVGDPTSVMTSDFALSSIGGLDGFEYQHNVHVLPGGELTLFDNRYGPERSRIVDLVVDDVAMTATMVRTWDVPGDLSAEGHCEFQGAAWRTAAGNPVATCAPFRKGTEFDAATGAVVWTGELNCRSGPGGYVPRFQPIDEP